MARMEAATRIVEIQGVLAESFLGQEKREALMFEQTELWDRHFLGKPFDEIAREDWLHRNLLRWG